MRRIFKIKTILPLFLAVALVTAMALPAPAYGSGEETAVSEPADPAGTETGEAAGSVPVEEPAPDTAEEEQPAKESAAPEQPAKESEPDYIEEPDYDFIEVSDGEFERLRSDGSSEEYIIDDDAMARTTREATGAQVVRVPATIEDFRFWTVAAKPAFAKDALVIREQKNGDARAVGELEKDGVLYILEDLGDGWFYAESGEARGFVKAEEVTAGKDADERFRALIKKAARFLDTVKGEDLYKKIDAKAAVSLVPPSENAAFAYLRATVHSVVADKVYALAKDKNLYIHEEKSEESRRVGLLPAGGLAYVLEGLVYDETKELTNAVLRRTEIRYAEMVERLASVGDGDKSAAVAEVVERLERNRRFVREESRGIIGAEEWLYVESGNARGFVKSEDLIADNGLQVRMRDEIEASFKKASTLTKREENVALYHTITSIRSGVPGGTVKESIVDYASQFIGNPYIWGGTDPVRGADCSGFVQTIYRQYGYSLPRLAQQQAMVGTMIDVADAEPGDLIFYQNNKGEIYHVVIYAGNGETVEAANEYDGISRGRVAGDACWAVRVIEDEEMTKVPETYENYPVGTDNCYTVTHNYGTRNWAYPCRRIHQKWVEAGSVYTENVATIDGYRLIACTPLFGTVGDIITWYFDDGSTLDTIMADTKSSSDPNYTPWGHISGDVINVLEFETDQLIHPGTADCIPQIAYKRVTGWKNLGRGL